MDKISKYISQKILYTYLTIYMCIIGLLFIAQTIKLLKYIPASAIKFNYIVKFGLLLLPNSLYAASGIICVIVLYSVYNSFLITSELVAMKASGFSQFKILKPAFITILINFLLFFIIAFFVTPSANKTFEKGIANIRDSYILSILKAGEVVSFKNLGIYYQDLQDNKMLNFVILKTSEEDDFTKFYSIYAKSAYIEENALDGSWVVMNFVEISDIKIPKNEAEQIESNVNTAREMRLQMNTLLTKTEESQFYIHPREMNLWKLIASSGRSEYYFEIHKRFSVLYYAIFASMAIIFGLSEIKTSRGKNLKHKVLSIIFAGFFIVCAHILSNILIKQQLYLGEYILYLLPVCILFGFYQYMKRL